MSHYEDDWISDSDLEQIKNEAYGEHYSQAIEEFTAECLQRYYIAQPDVILDPSRALSEAKKLLAEFPTASLVLAVAAIEATLKEALLRPIIYGSVYDEDFAGIITDQLLDKAASLARIAKILFQALSKHGQIDLKSDSRPGSSEPLWQEIDRLQKERNRILHRAKFVANETPATGIAVASFILDDVFPRVVRSVGLHLHGMRICLNQGSEVCQVQGSFLEPEHGTHNFPELRVYIRALDSRLGGILDQAANFQFERDTLIIAFLNQIYLSEMLHYRDRLARLCSEFYKHDISVEILAPRFDLTDLPELRGFIRSHDVSLAAEMEGVCFLELQSKLLNVHIFASDYLKPISDRSQQIADFASEHYKGFIMLKVYNTKGEQIAYSSSIRHTKVTLRA